MTILGKGLNPEFPDNKVFISKKGYFMG